MGKTKAAKPAKSSKSRSKSMAPKGSQPKTTKPVKAAKTAKPGKLAAIKDMLLGKKKAAMPAPTPKTLKTPKPAPIAAKTPEIKTDKKADPKKAASKAAAAAKAPAAVQSAAASPAPVAAKGKKGRGRGKNAAHSGNGRMIDPNSNHCREVSCELLASASGYCRLHYIKNWKKIKRKETIMKEGKLNQYIEELVAKYPDKYIEAIRMDLANDKEFMKVIRDLELDESIDEFESENEPVEGIIDTIRRDIEDDGDMF